MLMYLLASASMDLDPGSLDLLLPLQVCQHAMPASQLHVSSWVYGVQRLAHLSVLYSGSGNVKKFPTLMTIRFMRLMGVGEGWGSQGETGMVQG